MPDALPQAHIASFLTHRGEEIVVATRRHWMVLVPPLTTVFFLTAVFVTASIAIFVFLLESLVFLLLGIFFTALIAILITTKIFVDWYYNLYIVTTRKILEFSYSPLFSHQVNEVRLDQVRITEVDTRIQNFLHEILDVGDVVLIFDHISHENGFTLTSVPNPRRISAKLAEAMETLTASSGSWYQTLGMSNQPPASGTLYPNQSASYSNLTGGAPENYQLRERRML